MYTARELCRIYTATGDASAKQSQTCQLIYRAQRTVRPIASNGVMTVFAAVVGFELALRLDIDVLALRHAEGNG
jgi:hypothetical protein